MLGTAVSLYLPRFAVGKRSGRSCLALAHALAAQAVDRALQGVSAVAPGLLLVSVVEFEREPLKILFVLSEIGPYKRQKALPELLTACGAEVLLRPGEQVRGMREADAP